VETNLFINMKQLKFAEPLLKLVLSGVKTSTWRINDTRDIVEGDELSLCFVDGVEYAKAVVTKVKITSFGELTDEDKVGHESFRSDEEMYETYSRYYKMLVTSDTELKIIWFELLENYNN